MTVTPLLLILALAEASPAPIPGPTGERSRVASVTAAKHRGMSYAHGFKRGDRVGYDTPHSARSLARLAEMGVDWVSITPFGFMSLPHDTTITWGRRGIAESDEALRQATADAHALGLRVMLKPHIWLRPPEWPGTVAPRDEAGWHAWFQSYRAFIVHYAEVARRTGADAFCIGTELEKTTPHAAPWREIIAAVRKTYTGPLTYAANPQEVHAVPFWDLLDFIGVNGYYPLSPSRTPTVEELVAAWSPESKRLSALSARWKRKVVFTELGYRSADFGAWRHWEIKDDAPVNLAAQKNAYEAFFKAVWPLPWCGGVYWWKWFSFRDHSGPTSNDFELENKPAEKVVERHYKARR